MSTQVMFAFVDIWGDCEQKGANSRAYMEYRWSSKKPDARDELGVKIGASKAENSLSAYPCRTAEVLIRGWMDLGPIFQSRDKQGTKTQI